MQKIATLLFTILLLGTLTVSTAPLKLNFLQSLQTFQDQTLTKTSNINMPKKNDKTDFKEIGEITDQDDKNMVEDANDAIVDDLNQENILEMNLNKGNSRRMKEMPNTIQRQNYVSRNFQHNPLFQNQVQHQMFKPQHVKNHNEPSLQSNPDMLYDMHNQMLPQQSLPNYQVPLIQPLNEDMLNEMQQPMLTPQNFHMNQEYIPQLIHQDMQNSNHYQMLAPQEYQDTIMNRDEMMTPVQDMSLINQIAMQQQILSLHRLQALQNLNAMNMMHQQSLLVFLPTNLLKNTESDVDAAPDKMDVTSSDNKNGVDGNYDPESVVIEADHTDNDEMAAMNTPHAMLIFPNPNKRFSIGEIISGISWLPIEVNVPDTIAWAYNGISNGISGIWSVIGQWPFRRPTPVIQMKMNPKMNMFLKQMTYQGQQPLVMALPQNAQFGQLPLIFP